MLLTETFGLWALEVLKTSRKKYDDLLWRYVPYFAKMCDGKVVKLKANFSMQIKQLRPLLFMVL